MCQFQHGTIQCRGDGYLVDADHDSYDPNDFSDPCPQCNTQTWLENQKLEAESTIEFEGYDRGTGVDIWLNAVEVARRENPDHVDAPLKNIGKVGALFPLAGTSPETDDVGTREFIYA